MNVRPIANPISGEHVLAVEPRMELTVDGGWRVRSHLYAGRALTDTALRGDQKARDGRLDLAGQWVTPGVVAGLDVTIVQMAIESDKVELYVEVGPGRGLTVRGQDVFVPRRIRVGISSLIKQSKEFWADHPDAAALTAADWRVATLILCPVQWEDRPAARFDLPPEDASFEDRRIVEGCILLLYPWRYGFDSSWSNSRVRNGVAWMVFDEERQLVPGGMLHWEVEGVAIGLMGFGLNETPVFLDRHAVVRRGGVPRHRLPLVRQHGTPRLWQAQANQFRAQIAEFSVADITNGVARQAFVVVPPVGALPRHAATLQVEVGQSANDVANVPKVDPPISPPSSWTLQGTTHLFPADRFVVDYAPIPVEQMDGIFEACASLAPLSMAALSPDTHEDKRPVRMLVPVSEADYEPKLLSPEKLGPEPGEALKKAIKELGDRVHEQDILQLQHALLLDAIEGHKDERYSVAESVSLDEVADQYGISAGKIPILERTLRAYWVDGTWTLPDPPGVKADDVSLVDMTNGVIEGFAIRYHTNTVSWLRFNGTWSSAPIPTSIISHVLKIAAVRTEGARADLIAIVGPEPSRPKRKITLVRWTGTSWTRHDLAEDTATYKNLAIAAMPGGRGFRVFIAVPKSGDPETCDIREYAVGDGHWRADGGSLGTAKNVISLQACATTDKRIDLIVLAAPKNADGTPVKTLIHLYVDDNVVHYDPYKITGAQQFALISTRTGTFDLVWAREGHLEIVHQTFDGVWRQPRLLLHEGRLAKGIDYFAVASTAPGALNLLTGSGGDGYHIAKVPNDARSTIEREGVHGLIEHLQHIRMRIEDFVEGAFLRVQTEVDRVRQLMITGSTEATRYATSPILGTAMGQPPMSIHFDFQKLFSRTRDFDERSGLDRPDSEECLSKAAATRHSIVADMVKMARELGINLRMIRFPGLAYFVQNVAAGGEPVIVYQRRDMVLAEVGFSHDEVDNILQRIENEPEAIVAAKLSWSATEYFKRAVELHEHSMTHLREMEALSRRYAKFITTYTKLLEKLEAYASEAGLALQVKDGAVAEAEHDVVTARALLEEEILRIDTINKRRAKIIQERIPFFVYHRPRAVDPATSVPMLPLEPGAIGPVLPAAFATTAEAPRDLRALLDLLRDAPIGWFSQGPAMLGKLDRLDAMLRALETARVRTNPIPIKKFFAPASVAQTLSALWLSRKNNIVSVRETWIKAAPKPQESLQSLRRRALDTVSLGDLAAGDHENPKVTQLAAEELQHLSRVATYLYTQFGAVPPHVRLAWATILGPYDAAVDLKSLAVLPKWAPGVDTVSRRQLQALVDWLFSRMNANIPEATGLMNDIVRVCILLACHAPVDKLVTGKTASMTVVKPGGLILVNADGDRLRAGMLATFSVKEAPGSTEKTFTAQGILEDVAPAVATVRIVQTSTPTYNVPGNTVVTFAEPHAGAKT